MRREWKRRIAALACAALALGLAISAAPAAAVDSIYWHPFEQPAISRAPLDPGGETGDLSIPGGIPGNVRGIAIDAAGGRLYWNLGDTIEFANLDGSDRGTFTTTGAVLDDAISLAIDTVSRRLYWANSNPPAPTIGFASLDGSGGGNLDIAGATRPTAPLSLLVHPGGGRIYWADFASNRISFAALDGSGGADLDTTGAPIANPAGLAIDAGRQRVYWGNAGARAFGSASLAGGGGAELPLLGTSQVPFGVALDLQADRLYWNANTEKNRLIGSIPYPAGGASTPLPTPGSTVNAGTLNPILLKKPTTFGAPAPSLTPRPMHPGDRGPCIALWAPDVVEANLMQAPQTVTYEWSLNGTPIPGATEETVLVTAPGTYTCSSTATNFAGSATQTGIGFTATPGPARPRLKLVKVVPNRRKGTASLRLMVSGAGRLEVRGRKLAPVNRTTARTDSVVAVTLRTGGKAALRLLARKGVLKTTAKVTFRAGGESRSLSLRIVLKKTKPRR